MPRKYSRFSCNCRGPNGCGKTSIFEAIRVFKAILGPYHNSELNIIMGELRQQLGYFVMLGKEEAEITISFELEQNEKNYLSKNGHNIDSELSYNK